MNIHRRMALIAAVALALTAGLAEDVRTVTISAVGDCTLGRNYKMDYENSWDDLFSRYGPAYFLQNVAPLFLEDDLTLANLEGALSEDTPRQKLFYRQKRGPDLQEEILPPGQARISGGASAGRRGRCELCQQP